MANNDYNSGKATAVKFFMVLSCIASIVGGIVSIARNNLTFGIILLVSLVWTVPMTISASSRLSAHEYIGAGFKICTLLFHNLIAGIILLCMNTEGEEKKQQENPANKTSQSSSQSGNPKTTSIRPNQTQSAKTENKPVATVTPAINKSTTPPQTGFSSTKNFSGDFHHWTDYENEYCVRMVFDNFVCEQDGNVNQVVSKIYNKFSGNISKNSIHMKLSNIKYLLDEKKIRSSLPAGSLWQASSQCRTAFNKVYEEYKNAGRLPHEGPNSPPPPPPHTYKIKVTIDGKTYFYRHNVHDNKNNLIYNEFSYLMATALLPTESKIMAEELKKQYPTATINIVENVSD